jgi:hypothetical protein
MDYLSNCMKWRRGEACHFWPKPIILHPNRPPSDAPNMIIIMKAYGLRAQWYQQVKKFAIKVYIHIGGLVGGLRI